MKKERKLIIAGNWKMNKTVAEALDLVRDLKTELATIKEVDIVVFPPFTALSEVAKVVHGSNIHLGAQNMSEHNIGAHTGEIAALMLKELSVRYVILGHSERRQYQKESDELISKKAQAAHAASLQPIICVGETLAEHEAGRMEKVLETQVFGSLNGLGKDQIVNSIIAYEPVWAIGTGKTASRLKRKKRTSSSADYSSSCLTSQSLGASESNMVAVSIHPIRASYEPAGCGRRAGRRRIARSPEFYGHNQKFYLTKNQREKLRGCLLFRSTLRLAISKARSNSLTALFLFKYATTHA